jgi:luciferase family oxidoreductase group 1
MVPVSILDLAPVVEGSNPSEALRRSLDLAQHAEQWGYMRFWVAEHHNMNGIASAATSVVIGYIAGGTKHIRVGSGGIMLPNHSPLVIAEQFGTLESLYPGRIDLGLGRAPGTDQRTWHALRRDPEAAERFPQDVMELQILLGPSQAGQAYHATPGTDTNVPIWILGSSLFGAQLAAMLGLPFGFASHFAPDALMPALEIYRARYQPSERWPKPYAMVGCGVIVAETDEEARFLFTSVQQRIIGMVRGARGLTQPPVDNIDALWGPHEKAHAERMLACSFVGAPDTVRRGLQDFVAQTGADELMVTCGVYDHDAKLRSYELLAKEIAPTLTKSEATAA